MEHQASSPKKFPKISEIFERDRFVENYKKETDLKNKLSLQFVIALSFLILTVTNLIAKSYFMLCMTALGFLTNAVFALIALKCKNGKLSSCSSIVSCSLLFASFVICGGNDGFACLWVILLPLLAMVIMDFKFGLCASVFFQFFLIAVFWTPLNEKLLYDYNEQFCLRFPLFFFVTFMLGVLLTVSLRNAEYNEFKHFMELEEMNRQALLLSRIDPLTKLANRRYSFEQFETRFAASETPHCIVMSDIDNFKRINDQYGHEFGDEVLITISKLITETLPPDYLKSRWGGEEFLFAANAAPNEVSAQVEKLRSAVESHAFLFHADSLCITMTFGIAAYTGKEDLSGAINLADQRLYMGKSRSKNCIVFES